MGWFDDQIKERQKKDDALFFDAFAQLAETITSKRVARVSTDNKSLLQGAINDILSYYGEKTQDFPDGMKDENELLDYFMQVSGIMWRRINLDGVWYKDGVGVLMAHRKSDGKPVALFPKGIVGYYFYDIDTGKKTMITAENSELFERKALCFYKPLPARSLSRWDVFNYLIGMVPKGGIWAIMLTTIASILLGFAIPRLNRHIYGDVIFSESITILVSVFVFLLNIYLAQILISVYQNLLSRFIANKASTGFHCALMMRILTLPQSFFQKRSAGEIASGMAYIGKDVATLINVFCAMGLSAILSFVYIYAMAYYARELVWPVLILMLISILYIILATKLDAKNRQMVLKKREAEDGITYSFITGIQKIKLSGAEKRAFSKWTSYYKQIATEKNKKPFFVKIRGAIFSAITLLAMLITYYLAIMTNVEMADFFAFQSALGFMMGGLVSINEITKLWASTIPAIDLIRPILDTEPETEGVKLTIRNLMGGIEINNLSFRYSESMPLVIDDLSLKIRPGEYVAIVGESGCGKSTLLRLLLGFEKPSRGAIYYDGKDIESVDLRSLRKNIGTVMQNDKLFAGDIFSNITITAPNLTHDEAYDVAAMAGVDEDIRNMPMGMHTLISEGGGGISGGQRQRIIIARAIAGKPRILMFDEATSALDNVTQKSVSDSLQRLKCTRIVVAHRLSTIKNCDRVVVLDQGKIIEDGTYDELIANKGFFAELVERQRIEV